MSDNREKATTDQEAWRAGMKYAAEILEELNICGGGKIEQSVRADAIAEIRACLAGKLYPAPRKYLPPHLR